MSEQPKSTKTFGIVLAAIGIAFMLGGINLVRMGDNPYFILVGVGILASGVLVSQGRRLGASVYGATVAFIVIWSLVDVGTSPGALLPRILMPSLLGLYILFKVRPRLA